MTPLSKKAVERGEVRPIDIVELEGGVWKFLPLRHEVCYRSFILGLQLCAFWSALGIIILGVACGAGGVCAIEQFPTYAVLKGIFAGLVNVTSNVPTIFAYVARPRRNGVLGHNAEYSPLVVDV